MAPHSKDELVGSLLKCVQVEAAKHGTNAYQIAKATGIPLRSVQLLLKQAHNPTLRNVEIILTGLGLAMYLRSSGKKKTIPRAKRPASRRVS